MRYTGFPPAVRELIRERAQGFCEVCGWFNHPLEIHHRRPRGRGGSRRPETNLPSNALHACLKCHALIEIERTLAKRRGWLLSQWTPDPATVPVLRHGSEWVLLNNDGTVTPTTQPDGPSRNQP